MTQSFKYLKRNSIDVIKMSLQSHSELPLKVFKDTTGYGIPAARKS